MIKLNTCTQTNIQSFNNEIHINFSHSLSILNINIRSANTNFVSLAAFISQIKFVIKIIVVTESHTDDSTIQMYNLNGYRKLFTNRDTLGGGIITYIHNSLEFNMNRHYSGIHETHETLFFNLKCPGNPPLSINFLCVYVPHRRFIPKFVEYLGKLPKGIIRKNLLVIGDINACGQRDGKSSEFRTLYNFLATKNYTQLIEHPTYFSHQLNPSILDHVWSNINISSKSYVFSSAISDHIPSITIFDIPAKLPKILQVFRDFSLKNKQRLEKGIINDMMKLSQEIHKKVI